MNTETLPSNNQLQGAARILDPQAGAARLAAARAAAAAGLVLDNNPVAVEELDPASPAASDGYSARWSLPSARAAAAVAPAKPAVAPSTKPAREGYAALGYEDGHNVIWSNTRNCIVRLSPDELTKRKLETYAGLNWLLNTYLVKDEKGGSKLNLEKAGSDIISKCQAAGRFRESSVMGAGIWRVKINGRQELVCNSGDELFAASGVAVPRISGNSVFCESRHTMGMTPSIESLTDEEALELSDLFETWNWRNPNDAQRVLGWLAYAPFAGVLTARPHLCLTGKAGSGKTTALVAIKRLLGGSAIKADGSSTSAAGIRQALQHDALPIMLDEFGDNVSNSKHDQARTRQIQDQLVSGYSDDSDSLKGTADGRGNSYSVRYVGLTAGIIPPVMQAADRSRVVICQMAPLSKGARRSPLLADAERMVELGAKMRMRMFRNWDKFEASLVQMKAAFRRATRQYSDRFIDTMATGMAAWYVLMTARELDAVMADALLESANIEEHATESESISDERLCADLLVGYTPNGCALSIGEMIEQIDAGTSGYERTLEQSGIKVANGRVVVCSSAAIRGLREIYANGKFADGGWAKVLERVDGARQAKPRFAGKTFRAVDLPIEWVLERAVAPTQGQLSI